MVIDPWYSHKQFYDDPAMDKIQEDIDRKRQSQYEAFCEMLDEIKERKRVLLFWEKDNEGFLKRKVMKEFL